MLLGLGNGQVGAVRSAVAVAVSLCQRNTLRLEPQESESLWFRLLDRFVEYPMTGQGHLFVDKICF